MSDTASKKTEAQPNVGDLSSLSSEMLKSKRKGKKSTTKKVGDTKSMATAVANDVLGDITLLEEAFAEMEVSVADYEQEIPMLHSSLEETTNDVDTNTASPEDTDTSVSHHSIPLLDQHPSEVISTPSINSKVTAQDNDTEITSISSIPTLDSLSKTETEEQASVSHMSSAETGQDTLTSVLNIADVEEVVIGSPAQTQATNTKSENLATNNSSMSGTEEQVATEKEVLEEVLTASLEDITIELPSISATSEISTMSLHSEAAPIEGHSADKSESTLTALVESLNSTPGFAQTQTSEEISILDENATTNAPSIEDKIAQAAGDTSASEHSQMSIVAEKIEDKAVSEVISELVVETSTHDSTSNSDRSTQKVSKPDPSMSIPFELHSQLSRKIDDLVLDATMSLTTELQAQLSLQLESLLSNAVESVLPKLVDQMANELRAEVKSRVKMQLPIIVNEVLGKTRLSGK